MRLPFDLVSALLDRLVATLPEQDVSTEIGRFTIDVRPAFRGTNPVSGRRLHAPAQVGVVFVPTEALQQEALGPLLGKGVERLLDPAEQLDGLPLDREVVEHGAPPIYAAVVEGIQALRAPFPIGTGRSGFRVRDLGTFVVALRKRTEGEVERFDAQLVLRVDPVLAQRVTEAVLAAP